MRILRRRTVAGSAPPPRAAFLMLGVLLVVALAGCFGGPGSDKSNDDAQSADAAPTLPDDLTMDGAEVIHRTASSVTFRWEGVITLGTVATYPAEGPAHKRTLFDLAPDVRLGAEAWLEHNDYANLGIVLLDTDENEYCGEIGPSLLLPDRAYCAASYGPAPEGDVRGAVSVVANGPASVPANTAGEIPFTVQLTLKALPVRILHEVGKMLPFEAVADDGVGLRGHVYLPNGTGPFATVLEYSPYWNTATAHSEDLAVEAPDGRTTLGGCPACNELGPLLDAGFAVAAVNIRGMGESDGCLQWGSPRDIQDVATVIETLAGEPWSNGNIGMMGLSYPGWTQDMAVASGTPSLKAVVPTSPVQDLWNLWTVAGAPVTDTVSTGVSFVPLIDSGALAMADGGQPADNQPGHFACPEHVAASEAYARLIDSGDKTAFWQDRDLRPKLEGATVPTLASLGLQSEGHLHQFDGRWDLLDGPKHFVLGQMDHARPSDVRGDWSDLVVAFLDHHLRGGPAPWTDDHAEYQSDDGTWHSADQWPPKASEIVLRISDGTLVRDGSDLPASEHAFQSTYDPPVPVDCPGTQVLFVSEPVVEDVRLAGQFQVNLTLESTLPDGNLAAYVYQVDEVAACDPAKFAQARAEATDHAIRTNPGEVRRAMTDLRHRGHLEMGQDFPIASPESVHLTSYPFATTIEAGNRVVLGVSAGDPWLLDDLRKPVITVHTGLDVVGEVVLPVVEGELRFEGETIESNLLEDVV